MRYPSLLSILLACMPILLFAQEKKSTIDIPDIPGYKSLKCDFHIHTVFSDGKVWPTIRVSEALEEGLDAIAITDHLKYGKPGKYSEDIKGTPNRSFELALEEAVGSDLLVIKGAEITQGMPPGHINAIFLSDADIASKDFMETFREAKRQGAFIFWNHPHWKSPDSKWEQDGFAQWFDIHTKMLEEGLLMGIEVVNAKSYSREAHQWCLEHNLTMVANSDIHMLTSMEYDLNNSHRPMTIVFSEDRTEKGIKEALANQRTALWFENNLIGSQEYLSPIFRECIQVKQARYLEKLAIVTISNTSNLDFYLENVSEYSFFNKTRFIILHAGETLLLSVKTTDELDNFMLRFQVKNMFVAPDKNLTVELLCEKSGVIKDKNKIK